MAIIAIVTLQHSFAQSKKTNIFPPTGRAGINTTSPKATLQIIGGTRIGTKSNYLDVDSLTGNLSFKGTSQYIVGGNKYAFAFSGNPNYGLFFNQTNLQYEFRDSSAAPVFYINAINGNALVTGALTVGSYSFPVSDGMNGQVLASNGAGQLNWITASNGNTINVALGNNAFQSNISGYSNVAIGPGALNKTTTANNVIAIGDSALYKQNTNSKNIAIGSKALYSNLGGANNTAVGFQTLNKNTSANDNTAVGNLALYSNLVGSSNTAIGSQSLYNGVQGVGNTAVGAGSLYTDAYGDANTAIGFQSLYSNSVGVGNSALGYQSMYGNGVIGSYNTGIGYKALYRANNANSNTAVGVEALLSNYAGDDNTAIGSTALLSNNGGQDNTATGSGALWHNTTGEGNTALGSQSLYQNVYGKYNIAIGYETMYSNFTGSNNTIIGTYADVTSDFTNACALGYGATVNASNKVVIGNTDIKAIGGQVGWSTFSDGRFKTNIKENVPGLVFINKLKPVTYQIDLDKYDKFLGRPDSILDRTKNQTEINKKVIHTGFVAQEVEKAAKEINYDFDGVNHPQNEKDNYSLVYADFVPALVKAVQELSKLNSQKDAKINDLEDRLTKLEAIVNAQQTEVANSQYVNLTTASMEQNIPNPFSHTTTINYTLPPQYSSAKIVITDKAAKTLKEITLSNNGKGSLKIDASNFSSGAYQYALYVDGKLVDTNQMILSR